MEGMEQGRLFGMPTSRVVRVGVRAAAIVGAGLLVFIGVAFGPMALLDAVGSFPVSAAIGGVGLGMVATTLAEQYADPTKEFPTARELAGVVGWTLATLGALNAAGVLAEAWPALAVAGIVGPVAQAIGLAACDSAGEKLHAGGRGDRGPILRRIAVGALTVAGIAGIAAAAVLLTHAGGWAEPTLEGAAFGAGAFAAMPLARLARAGRSDRGVS